MSAPITMWVSERPSPEVRTALERLAGATDVEHVAVMPDVHLASGVCIGTVTATTRRLIPEAVGGDIGCGVAAVRFATSAALLASAKAAANVLAGLYRLVPFIRHAVREAPPLPDELARRPLSTAALTSLARRDGRIELGTLGRGNHFLELQRDEEDALWLMVHSGSRAIGPAIREYHVRAAPSEHGLSWLDAGTPEGAGYLADVAWARAYATLNRRHMVERVAELLDDLFGVQAEYSTLIDCDHNHVAPELIQARKLWVHRKGALRATDGEPGVIPGSMGTFSYHVMGRGEPGALCSSSHGAGRAMSRSEARRRISAQQLLDDAGSTWFDHRLSQRLREEAPGAYKDIGAVMRAQRDLTRIVRKLEPVLVYKGG